ncbi:hypothetical protein [Mycobacterium sp.]|nr:hypothetical protein [Mycobacterium sp.]
MTSRVNRSPECGDPVQRRVLGSWDTCQIGHRAGDELDAACA